MSFLGVAMALFVGVTGMLLPQMLRRHEATTPIPVIRGTTTIFALAVAGGRPREILRLHGQFGAPAGTRDGAILLEKWSSTESSIWLFDHGRRRRLGMLSTSALPIWSPDRTAYLTWDPGARAVVHRLDGTPLRTITRHRGLGGLTCSSWSGPYVACLRLARPDGRWRLELEVWRANGTLVRSRRLTSPFGSTTATVRPDGRVLVLRPFVRSDVAAFPAPQWTPDGKTMVYVDRHGRLRANDRVLLAHALGEFGLSADGRTVYVARWKPATSIPK